MIYSIKDSKIYLNWFVAIIKLFKNWPTYLLFAIGLLSKKEQMVYLRSGLKFAVRKKSGDMVAIIEDFYEQQYLPNKKCFGEEAVIVDLGAHIGTFSVLAAKMARGGMVFSYEPDKQNFVQLLKNIKLNNIENIKPLNSAVWKERRRINLYYNNNSSLGHSLIQGGGESNYYSVESLTLEDIFNSNNIKTCDLLKIDVEGAEYEILFSAPKKIYEKINSIYFEFHEDQAKRWGEKDLINFLKNNNYKINQLKNSNIIYADRF